MAVLYFHLCNISLIKIKYRIKKYLSWHVVTHTQNRKISLTVWPYKNISKSNRDIDNKKTAII